MKPRRKARIHQTCSCPGIHQEPEWPFAADADVGDDRSATDNPYRHNRRRTGLRRTGFLKHGQLYDHRPRHRRWRLAGVTPSEEGDDGSCSSLARPADSVGVGQASRLVGRDARRIVTRSSASLLRR